jgi:hypothetical protein
MLYWHIKKKSLLYGFIIFVTEIYVRGLSATWKWLHVELGLFCMSALVRAEHRCWESLCLHSSAFTFADASAPCLLVLAVLIPFVEIMDFEVNVFTLGLLHKWMYKKETSTVLGSFCSLFKTTDEAVLYAILRTRETTKVNFVITSACHEVF